MLLHQEGDPAQQSASEKQPSASRLQSLQQQHYPQQRRSNHKIRSVTFEAHHAGTGTKQRVTGSGHYPCQPAKKSRSQQKNNNGRRGIDKQKTQMDSAGSLAK